ncbi:MAG: hypothetical protein CMJ83_02655 [Planctomycetes bacterium]|nr:hypothetical protein [Planctomycetota bacterium]
MGRVAVIFLLLIGTQSPSQTVRASKLRALFKIPVKELKADGYLAATWRFAKVEEMRAFQEEEGLELTSDSGVMIQKNAALAWRELFFEGDLTMSFEVWAASEDGELRVILGAPGDRVNGVLAFFNGTIGDEKGRHCAAVKVVNGEPGEIRGALTVDLKPRTWHRIGFEVKAGTLTLIANGKRITARGVKVPRTFATTLYPAANRVHVRDLEIAGHVNLASLRKLVGGAKAASRSHPRNRGGGALAALRNEERRAVLDEILKVRKRSEPRDPGAAERQIRERNLAVGLINRATKAWRDDHFDVAIAELTKADANWFHPGAIAYLKGIIQFDARELDHALESLGEAAKARKKYVPALRAMALVHIEREDYDRAERVLAKARSMERKNGYTMAFLALAQMARGKLPQAQTSLRIAKDQMPSSDGVKLLLTHVQRLRSRPRWSAVHKKSNRWYAVETNVGGGVAADIAQDLERYRTFLEQALPLGIKQRRPVRVWVFDSQDEYLSFTEVLIRRAESSLGCYVPAIKTFLFFHTLDEEKNREVLYHEAFHHYLHQKTRRPPIWLDEGLAEYYGGTTFTSDGRATPGAIHHNRLIDLKDWLAKNRAIPLKALMHMAPATFMSPETAAVHYATSWAFVHWIKHAAPADAKKTFDTYVTSVLRKKPATAAWSASFAKLDVGKLDEQLRAYVTGVLFKKL